MNRPTKKQLLALIVALDLAAEHLNEDYIDGFKADAHDRQDIRQSADNCRLIAAELGVFIPGEKDRWEGIADYFMKGIK